MKDKNAVLCLCKGSQVCARCWRWPQASLRLGAQPATASAPRFKVHVLASVDEATYSDPSAVRMGDHPVIWTNERMAARNVYIFMGHGPWLFENEAFTTLFRNAILWAGEKQPLSKSK